MGRRDSLHADQYEQGTSARHQSTAVRSGQSRHSQSGSHSEGTLMKDLNHKVQGSPQSKLQNKLFFFQSVKVGEFP